MEKFTGEFCAIMGGKGGRRLRVPYILCRSGSQTPLRKEHFTPLKSKPSTSSTMLTALPLRSPSSAKHRWSPAMRIFAALVTTSLRYGRSEEHTSELQSLRH